MRYDDKTKCSKCGADLKYIVIDDTYTHDGGVYDSCYRYALPQYSKEVGLDRYCNHCYENIGTDSVKDLIEIGNKYLENELTKAEEELYEFYKNKKEQLEGIRQHTLSVIERLENFEKVKDVDADTLNDLLQTSELYMHTRQEIRVGFPPCRQKSEIRELLKNIK